MSAVLAAHRRNGQAVPLRDVPELPLSGLPGGRHPGRAGRPARLACLCADTERRLFAVLADDAARTLRVGRTRLDGPRYPSLTPECPQAHLFEREMAEQFGIIPEGHPWFKPVRCHRPWNGAADPWDRPADLAARR